MKEKWLQIYRTLALALSILLIMPMLAFTANSADALSREAVISESLQKAMQDTFAKSHRVIIWLRDIDSEEAIAANTILLEMCLVLNL